MSPFGDEATALLTKVRQHKIALRTLMDEVDEFAQSLRHQADSSNHAKLITQLDTGVSDCERGFRRISMALLGQFV